MGNKKKAVIQTLVYSSLFNSPLTFNELFYFLQNDEGIKRDELNHTLTALRDIVVKRNNFYTLRGYEKIINHRQERIINSQQKVKDAQKVCQLLSLFPTVLFIGVSGSVAVGNATQEDDIDLFIITSSNSLYTTRLFLLVLLQLLGRRRKRNEVHAKNKICLNMFVDESALAFPEKSHDLYTAREIMQVYPIFERGSTYQKFLEANLWTKHLLSNANGLHVSHRQKNRASHQFFVVFEPFLKYMEQWLMRRHQTQERIEDHLLALHPNDVKNTILFDFTKRVSKYKKYYK